MKISRDKFERLAIEQLDAVDRIARALAPHSAEADDLVQETYVRALRSANSFDLQPCGIKPWLLRILHNLHITRATRENRQPRAIPAEHLHAIEEPERAGDPAIALDDIDHELQLAMAELPRELSVTVMLWAIDELPYKEIAEVTNVPIGTVMSRLNRARSRLARRLRKLNPHAHPLN